MDIPTVVETIFTLLVIAVAIALLPSRYSLWRWLFLILEKERIRVINERKPKRIVLIRHGESAGNLNPEAYGCTPDWKIPLTEKGHQQAIEAGRFIKSVVGEEKVFFYVSPYVRAFETFLDCAKSLSEKQFAWREEPRLRELEWGNFANSAVQESCQRDRLVVGKFFYRFPNGESGADVFDRVSVFLETLFRSFNKDMWNKAENYILVSHGLLIRLFLMRYFHLTVSEFESMENLHNCQMVVLEKDSTGRYQISPLHGFYENGNPVHFPHFDTKSRIERP
eukprot:ANDGO_01985.mRNA.1 Phosphoglycerate mutase-like protein AT74H